MWPNWLINPINIILRINLRNLFASDTKIGWDDVIPPGLHKTWVDILTTFLRMGEITLSRAVKPERTVGRPIIIGYADGSLDAYGCSVYIRWELDSDCVSGDQWYFICLFVWFNHIQQGLLPNLFSTEGVFTHPSPSPHGFSIFRPKNQVWGSKTGTTLPVNGCYDGRIAQILGLVGLNLNFMVASGAKEWKL